MNKFETAIAEIQDRAVHTLKTVMSAKTAETVVEALQEKQANKLFENACQLIGQEFNCSYDYVLSCIKSQAERDKMRCENCKVRKSSDCPMTVQENGYSYCSDDDFCSRFEPKENENG